jgi:hypothetical protein
MEWNWYLGNQFDSKLGSSHLTEHARNIPSERLLRIRK